MKKNELNFFKYDVYLWEKVLENLIKKTGLVNPFVLDIGAATGSSLVALSQIGIAKSVLVDPNWKLHTKALKKYKINKQYYKKLGIKVMDICGNDKSVPYKEADLIIKTFNPWVKWSDILKRTKANWFISDNQWLEPDDYKKLEIVCRFDISLGMKYDPQYLLLKRK